MSCSDGYTETDVKEYNEKVEATLEEGDIVRFDRGQYFHFAIYIGNGEFVEKTTSMYKSMPASFSQTVTGKVKKSKFDEVAKGCKAEKYNTKDAQMQPKPVNDILRDLRDATLSKEKWSYNLLTDNCEHFANEMRYGIKMSEQVDNFFVALNNLLKVIRSTKTSSAENAIERNKKHEAELPICQESPSSEILDQDLEFLSDVLGPNFHLAPSAQNDIFGRKVLDSPSTYLGQVVGKEQQGSALEELNYESRRREVISMLRNLTGLMFEDGSQGNHLASSTQKDIFERQNLGSLLTPQSQVIGREQPDSTLTDLLKEFRRWELDPILTGLRHVDGSHESDRQEQVHDVGTPPLGSVLPDLRFESQRSDVPSIVKLDNRWASSTQKEIFERRNLASLLTTQSQVAGREQQGSALADLWNESRRWETNSILTGLRHLDGSHESGRQEQVHDVGTLPFGSALPDLRFESQRSDVPGIIQLDNRWASSTQKDIFERHNLASLLTTQSQVAGREQQGSALPDLRNESRRWETNSILTDLRHLDGSHESGRQEQVHGVGTPPFGSALPDLRFESQRSDVPSIVKLDNRWASSTQKDIFERRNLASLLTTQSQVAGREQQGSALPDLWNESRRRETNSILTDLRHLDGSHESGRQEQVHDAFNQKRGSGIQMDSSSESPSHDSHNWSLEPMRFNMPLSDNHHSAGMSSFNFDVPVTTNRQMQSSFDFNNIERSDTPSLCNLL